MATQLHVWGGRMKHGDCFGREGMTVVQLAVLWCQCRARVAQLAVLLLGGGGNKGVVDVCVVDGGWGCAE